MDELISIIENAIKVGRKGVFIISLGSTPTPPISDFLLLQDDFFLLLQDGFKIEL